MEPNLQTYSSNEVVAYYKKYEGLQKPEQAILDLLRLRLPEMRMLDIGIGAGRTTLHFAPLVKEYTGVDYAKTMVEACMKKFEGKLTNARFLQADARNLENFEEGAFDLVLFSFNGIDYILPEERAHTLEQVKRVLKKGGLFCFSTHNLISLLDFTAFEFRLNMVAAIKRVFEVRKIKKINKKQFSEAPLADYLRINDGAHDFSLETCYYRPSYQVKQLQEAGFSDIRIYTHTEGRILEQEKEQSSGKEKWLYYLCAKVKT